MCDLCFAGKRSTIGNFTPAQCSGTVAVCVTSNIDDHSRSRTPAQSGSRGQEREDVSDVRSQSERKKVALYEPQGKLCLCIIIIISAATGSRFAAGDDGKVSEEQRATALKDAQTKLVKR